MSSIITFDAIAAVITDDSVDIPNENNFVQLLKPYETMFASGQLPYIARSVSTSQVVNVVNKDFKEHAEFISHKMKLDKGETSQLIDIFAKKIQGASVENPESSYSPSNVNVISYFISMITDQQSLFFKLITKVVKYSGSNVHLQKLKTLILHNGHDIIDNIISDVEHVLEILGNLSLNSDSYIPSTCTPTEDLDLLISNHLNCLLSDLLTFTVYIILEAERGFKVSSVHKWMKLLEKKSTYSIFYASEEIKQSVENIFTIITLLFFDMEHNTGSLVDNSTFMSNADTMVEFTNIIMNSNSSAIILYAWSIVLHRQFTALELAKDTTEGIEYEKKLSNTILSNIELISMKLAEEAAKGNFCEQLSQCHTLISNDHIFSSILGTFVVSFVPYIEPTDQIISVIAEVLRNSSNKVIENFFSSPFTDELLILLRAKLPFTLNSFLELISINSNLAVEELRLLPTFMTSLPTAELDPKFIIDDQQPELVKLTEDVQVGLPFELKENLLLKIAKGTKAQIVSRDEKKTLALFLYDYNGWSLLGRVLMNLSIKIDTDEVEKTKARKIIIKALDNIIKDLDVKVINLIFESFESFIDGKKMFDVLLRIFDQSLVLKDSELASNCLNLFESLFKKGYSSTIWSLLCNSKLFATSCSAGLAFEIIAKVEVTSGSFQFAVSLLQIANTLLGSALSIEGETAFSLKSDLIAHLTDITLRIYENFTNWRYVDEHSKYQIGALCLSFLNDVIKYGTTVSRKNFDSLLGVLKPSFEKVTTLFFISDIEDSLSIGPLISSLEHLSNPQIGYTSTNKPGFHYRMWIDNSLKFLSTILKLRSSMHPENPSVLEKQLFSSLPKIVKAYLLNRKYRLKLTLMLTEMVKSKWNDAPPSMLTHLRSTYSIIFLNCLQEEISFEHTDNTAISGTFQLISAVMGNNQKGLSHFLLTGKSVIDHKSSLTSNKSSLSSTLRKCVLEGKSNSPEYIFHLLDALLLSMSIKRVPFPEEDEVKFINRLIHIRESRVIANNAWDMNIVAKIVEILSLYLYLSNGENKKCEAKIRSLLNSSQFIDALGAMFIIQQDELTVIRHLDSEFQSLLGDHYCVNQFEVNNSHESPMITNNIYNVELISSMLYGSKPEQWQDVLATLVDVDKIHKLADSQMARAKAYGGLITCFCNTSPGELSSYYSHLSMQLLKINVDEGIFSDEQEQIYQGRGELAFLIILTLSNSKKTIDEKIALDMMRYTMKLLVSSEVALFDCLKSLDKGYYRVLLRILLLIVPLIKSPQLTAENSILILDVFKDCVCKPVSEIFSFIRNYTLSAPNPESFDHGLISKQTEDVLLLLSLTQQFLKLNLRGESVGGMADIIINTGAYRAVALVFSSSHMIQMNSKEPYIDYSVAFIFEFIQQKRVAERLLHEGIFCLITESPVATIIQRGNISPYSNNKGIITLHRLWVKRLLPIVLTLAAHFGEGIAIRLCEFALVFKKQFMYTLQSWLVTDSLISTSIIEETEQLVLLAKLMSALDCYNIVAQESGKTSNEVAIIPGLDTIQERTIFVNALNYLLSHPKYLAMKVRTIDGEMTITEFAEELKLLKDSLLV
jgi:nuclear pore complex protein Nup188